MSTPTSEPTPCEWTECIDSATHALTVDLPEGGGRMWHVCSEHDKDVKGDVVRSRPRPEPPAPAGGSSVTVQCANCEIPLNEASRLPIPDRQPCPICGSLQRQDQAILGGKMEAHGQLRAVVKRAGAKKFAQRFKTGDDFTRATQTWGTRTLHLDRENGTYREEILLQDGTRIESRAALHDHRSH